MNCVIKILSKIIKGFISIIEYIYDYIVDGISLIIYEAPYSKQGNRLIIK